MNDKELLMMAAKAVGVPLVERIGLQKDYFADDRTGNEWNPRTKESDSLSLAAKLSFSIFYSEQFVEINFDDKSGKVDFFSVIEFFPPDDFEMKMSATMLAITRAAAEIGSKL